MAVSQTQIQNVLQKLELPDGGNLVSRDMVRALMIDDGAVRFVIEAPSPDMARQMEPLRQAAERETLPGDSQRHNRPDHRPAWHRLGRR